jgi:hypothetical protein
LLGEVAPKRIVQARKIGLMDNVRLRSGHQVEPR